MLASRAVERKWGEWARMQYCSWTAVGSRKINEDSVGVFAGETGGCFIVADGLGGHGKGDIASALAVKAFDETFSDLDGGSLPELLERSFLSAQTSILEEQRRLGCPFQMKTTVCALAIRGDQCAWGHIGDSRVYAFSRGKVKERTLDHSVPQMLVATREIKEKQIRNHPERNKLLRVLGVAGDTPRFEISQPRELGKYQAFLLCSDGFWELILEKEMGTLLKHSATVQEWMDGMVEVVERRGEGVDMDNFSAVAIWV